MRPPNPSAPTSPSSVPKRPWSRASSISSAPAVAASSGPPQPRRDLEGSKAFAKALHAASRNSHRAFRDRRDPDEAREALRRHSTIPVVLKADGLAAGKGVIIAQIAHEAEAAHRSASATGSPLVIEEFLAGEEVSFIVLSDGEQRGCRSSRRRTTRPSSTATRSQHRRHGRVLRRPHPHASRSKQILDGRSFARHHAMRTEGYRSPASSMPGLMMTADGPRVLEFNVRLGDPETQPLMHRMASDFVAAADGRRRAADSTRRDIDWHAGAVGLRRAGGRAAIPGNVPNRRSDHRNRNCERDRSFKPAPQAWPKRLDTAGGRVLGVTASGRRPRDRRSPTPTRTSTRFTSTACTTAAISAQKA